MRVQELIEKLKLQDPEAPVGIVYDGVDRMEVQSVWLSRCKRVLLSDNNQVVYDDEDRPHYSTLRVEDPYWDTSQLKEIVS